jgi:hypothetical protein
MVSPFKNENHEFAQDFRSTLYKTTSRLDTSPMVAPVKKAEAISPTILLHQPAEPINVINELQQ